jgi:hypothetical protein
MPVTFVFPEHSYKFFNDLPAHTRGGPGDDQGTFKDLQVFGRRASAAGSGFGPVWRDVRRHRAERIP